MKISHVIILCLVVYFTCTFSNCQPGSGQNNYVVTYTEPVNYDLVLTNKTVGINVTAPAGYHTTQILLSNWFAGHNTGAPAQEFAVDFDGNFTFTKPLPQSEHLAGCEAMYYEFAITYSTPSGQTGAFFGQPQRVMPTKSLGPNGTIEQALCVEPPGPEVTGL